MNIKIDMSLCRVCRKHGPGTNIYTGDILEKFLYTTLVQVEKNDGLSEIICKKCLARLHIAYEFKKDAVTTNKELRSFLLKVNKDYQQLTAGSGGAKSKNKLRNEHIQMDGVESYDELDENIDALIEEQEGQVYRVVDDDTLTEEKPSTDDNNQELVEILATDNGAVELQETHATRRLVAIADNANEGPSEGVAVYFIEDNNEDEHEDEMDSNDSDYVPNEYSDENASDVITNEDIDEAQYLEYDENVDQLSDARSPKKQGTPRKQTKSSSNYNGDNRCDVCNKVFSTRTNLTRHKITHEGRKPYVCKLCGSSFTQNGSLKSHMFIHTGERPFKCTQCNKGFTQSKSLVFHMRRHTGEKPFPCDHCGVQFRQKDGLKRHIAAKHSTNPSKYHVCEVCGKTLLSKYSLNLHISKHTAKEVATAKKNRLKSERAAAKNSATAILIKTENDKSMEAVDEAYEIYGCEYCDQEFTNTTDLLEHRETHAEVQATNYIDDSS